MWQNVEQRIIFEDLGLTSLNAFQGGLPDAHLDMQEL